MAYELDPNYKQVPERIADFKARWPEGNLEPVNKARPYWIERIPVVTELDDRSLVESTRTFIVYAAAAYRSPRDEHPGIGLAWEIFPGKTPYTKDSELQNAETSAWGRAIVAALASESKSIASAEDVRNREADRSVVDPWQVFGYQSESDYETIHGQVTAAWAQLEPEQIEELRAWLVQKGHPRKWPLPADIADALFDRVRAIVGQSTEPVAVAAQPLVAASEPPPAMSESGETSESHTATIGEAVHEAAESATKTARPPSARDLERIAGSQEAAQAALDRAIREVTILSTAGVTNELSRRKLSKDGTADERKRRLAIAMAAEDAAAAPDATITPMGPAVAANIAAAQSNTFKRSPAAGSMPGEIGTTDGEPQAGDDSPAGILPPNDHDTPTTDVPPDSGDSRQLDEAGHPVADDDEPF
jgi:hypothetical protein